MASLLSFVKRVANTVNNDVVKPIQRDVVQPVAQSAHTVYSGAAAPVRLAAGEISHNNQAIQNARASAPTPLRFGAALGNLGTFAVGGPIARGAEAGIHGAVGAFAPQIAPRIAAGVTSGLGHYATPKILTTATKYGVPALTGSALNAVNAPTGAIASGVPIRQAIKTIPQAAVVGAGLGLAGPVAGDLTRGTIKGARAVNNARVPLNQAGAVGKSVDKNVPTPPDFLKPGVPKLPSELNSKVTAKLTSNVPKDLGANKNPMVGKVEIPKAQDTGQAHLNAQFVAGHEQRVGATAQTELAKLSSKDQNLMRGIQINGVQKLAPKAENPQQFVKTEGALRNYYNLRHAYDTSLGIPTPYRQNYLRDLMPPQEGGTFPAQGGNLAPGYTKAKTVPGATPVAEGLAKDIAGSSFNHAKLTYAKGLEEAHPGQISRGSPIVGPEGVTQQLTTPYGNELFATKGLANKINERGVSPQATGALGKYDTVNAFMKYVKLSGGAFHAFTEGGNFIGQQLMSGKLFTEPGSTAKVFKTFFSSKALNKEASALRANGTFDKAELSGLTWTPKAIKADVNVTPHGTVAKYTGIKALHDATFQRELPYIKLKTFEQKTQGLDIHNPEDLAKMRSIAKGINSEIGGQNRLLEGSFTPKTARALSRFLLATDFTEGKARTVLAALSKGGEEGKLAREVIAGKALVFAGLATGGAALTGELKGKSPTQVAENILKNFADPSWTSGKNTVSLPATHISEFTKPFKSFVDGSKDKFYGIKHYGSSRLAAVPSEITQLVNNQDYTGNHIYGKNTKKAGGQPISPGGTALNITKGLGPIPYGQGASAVQGKQSPLATVGNIAGLRVYPTPAAKNNTTSGANTAAATPAQQQANAKVEKAQFTTEAGKNGGYGLNKLSDGTYVYNLNGKVHTANNIQTAQKAIRDDAFSKGTGSYKYVPNVNGTGVVVRRGADGKVTEESKVKFDYQLGTATLTMQKNSGDLKGYLNTAKSQIASIATQLKDPSTDPLEALTLQNQADTLQKNIDKYAGYGGFTKPKAPKKGRGLGGFAGSGQAKYTIPKIAGAKTIKAPKGITVKKLAAFKQPKTRKLAVGKIPKIKIG